MDRDAELVRALAAIRDGRRPSDLESTTLDFKEDAKSPEEMMREAAQATICFANSEGGLIVIGVSDKLVGDAAFKGTKLDTVQVQKRIYELTRPPLTVDAREHFFNNIRLLLLFVPRSFEIHSDTQGRATRRIGTDCLALDPQQQMRLREERLGIDYSALPSGRRVRDASPQAIAAARSMLSNTLDERRKLAKVSERDLLNALGVTSPTDELSRAGELLFCAMPDADGPCVVYEYRATPGGEPRTVERLTFPLLPAFQRLMELVRARRNVTSLTLPTGVQIQIEDFPELAVREALVNGIIHRDYHLSGPVHVAHSGDILKVISPGPLVSGITPENILTHPSKPRNPVLTKAVRTLGVAEEIGTGVDRMFREMIRSGREVPKIESSFDNVTVTLVGGKANVGIARLVAQLPMDERDDTDTLLTLFRLCSTPTVRAEDLSPLIQKSEQECEAVLRRLVSDGVGILEPTRATVRRAFPSYRLRSEAIKTLGTALPYQRRTMDDIDRKVIAHVREYKVITNRTIQNMLDVNLQRARQLLSDLVEREVLMKVSAHERGPGVEYGTGRKFPSPKKAGGPAVSPRQLGFELSRARTNAGKPAKSPKR
jgi:ATP-dependent DNA helicase RecG